MTRTAASLFSIAVLATVCCSPAPVRGSDGASDTSLSSVIDAVQPAIVKIYGAGGFRGLEAYQSAFLISADGQMLTVYSYVIDTDYITAVLNDGRRFEAELVGVDPRLELAVLKIKQEVSGLPHFPLELAAEADTGTRVLAFSNLYGVASGDEPASVQHGAVAVKTRLEARRGVFETRYRGDVYVLDAMTNNPGSAGGALTNARGELLGMLGKELRNALNNTWLNYAIPVSELEESVAKIQSGESPGPADDVALPKPQFALTLEALGLVLIPDVVERTPPFIDRVRPGTPAAAAGLKPDDMVLFVNDNLIQSCKALRGELEFIAWDQPVTLTLIRGDELVTVQLQADDVDVP